MKIYIGQGKGEHKIFRDKWPLVPVELEDQFLSNPDINGFR